MSHPRTSRIVFVGGAETLLGVERGLARHGVRVDRIPAFRYAPTAHDRLRKTLRRFGAYDVVLLTSKEAARVMVDLGAIPRSQGRAAHPKMVVGGPATARALSVAGIRATWSPKQGVGRAIAGRLRHRPPLRIVYPRSDRAGPGLAATLRRQGHTVLDLVAYRVLPVGPVSRSARWNLARADRLVVTSPSALSYLRRALDTRSFRALQRRRTLVVLGEKSARSARGHGFRDVRVAPSLSDASFRDFLLAELDHAH